MWEFATEESIAWSIVSPKWSSSQSKWNCSCTREQQVASRQYCQRLSTSASTDVHNKNEQEKLPRNETKIETETQLEIEIKIGIRNYADEALRLRTRQAAWDDAQIGLWSLEGEQRGGGVARWVL